MADYFEEARQTDTTMPVTTADTTPETTALAAPSTEGPTTMAYPPGVSLATITIGAGRTMFGAAPKLISATVTPIFQGTPHVVHAASGWPFYPTPRTFRVENGEELSFELPHVNAEGWRDTAGNEFPALLDSGERDRGWAYHAKFTVIGGSGQDAIPHRYEKVFQPLVGQTEPLDLDLVPDGQIGEPVTAPVALVTSVAGLTGSVTRDDLLALGLGLPLEDVQAVADAAGDQAVIDAGAYTDEQVGALSSATLSRVVALEEGRVVPQDDLSGWLTARIANTNEGGVIDLMGRDITVTSTVVLAKALTLRNGILRNADARVLLVSAPGVVLERMSFVRTGSGMADGGAAVYVQQEGFQSTDCHYSSTVASALVLQHGTCNRSRIVGGTATSYARKQNSAGIYVSAGNVGNYGIVIDGVTVIGGADRGPDGVVVFDANGCVVRNCIVRSLRALPDVTIPQTWTLTATANVWESGIVRSDGPTRVILVNGTERAEETVTPTAPAANKWGIADGKVYLNSTVDPNTQTIVSRIVSGYGITLYCTAGAWRDMSRNVVAHNRVEDVDGFGIYLQLGDPSAVGNATDTNVLISTCLKGLQSGSLPFSALGVIGGKQTTLSNDLIDGAGVTGATAPGIKVNWSNNAPTDPSTGQIIGARIRNATRSGVQVNGGAWQLTNLNVTKCDNAGILIQPEGNDATINTVITNCEVSFCAWQGLSADSNSYTGAQVNVAVVGGYWRKNGSFGAMVRACRTVAIGAGAIFDANPSGGLHISTGNNTVHLDGVTFTNSHGLTVDNSVVNFTTGRLLWGVNVATRVQGTGAVRVLDVFVVPTVTSPNGTRYKLAVSDAGALTAVAI